MIKITKSKLWEALIDFALQDNSLMDKAFSGLPLYSRTELIARYVIFIVIALILWSIFKPGNLLQVIVLIFVSHFLNWFFNGHGYQIFFEVIDMEYSASKAIKYVLKLREESMRRGLHVMIYGSWARGKASKRSDLDIFIINVHGGIFSVLKMCFISLKYRFLALFNLLSVDIYVIDKVEYLVWRSKRVPEESPIILNDPTGIMRRIYGRERELKEFIEDIQKTYKSS
jgi:predicted nucleotidyltransferase